MAMNFRDPEVKRLRGERSLEVLVVPARIDKSDSALVDKFQREFLQRFGRFLPEVISDPIAIWELNIPYIPKYSFSEIVAVREKGRASAEDMIRAFRKLADTLTLMGKLDSEREEYPNDQAKWYRPISQIITVAGSTSIETAFGRLMRPIVIDGMPRKISHLVVVDRDKIVGVVTIELLESYLSSHPLTTGTRVQTNRVADWMTPEDQILKLKASISQDQALLEVRQKRERFAESRSVFAVDDQQQIIGFATTVDIF
jgi:CBS domain-containing protein